MSPVVKEWGVRQGKVQKSIAGSNDCWSKSLLPWICRMMDVLRVAVKSTEGNWDIGGSPIWTEQLSLSVCVCRCVNICNFSKLMV